MIHHMTVTVSATIAHLWLIYSAQLHQRKFSLPTHKVISQLINICAVNGNFCL